MGQRSSVRRYVGQRRPPMLLSQLSFTGMRDNVDPSTWSERKATLLQNVYPLDPEIGGGAWGRPGFRRILTQLGVSSTRQVQCWHQFTKLDGTELTLAFAGGRMYHVDWETNTAAEIALSGAGVALPTSGLVFCLTFADRVIVNPNDGVSRPFEASYSAGSWSFASLTNADFAYGSPWVYYAKLGFIKWAERNTIIWSEEMEPNVGYEALIGPIQYDNAWTLGQTDQEALCVVVGTNEALYYFRERSIGLIYGEVTDNFRSTGTLEGVSQTIGTKSPAGVTLHEGKIYFLDSDGRPQVIDGIGAGVRAAPSPIWEDARETCRRLPKDQLGKAFAVNWTPGNLILFGVCDKGATEPNLLLGFDADRGEFTCLWRGFAFTAIAMVKNAAGQPTMVHGDQNGNVYHHGQPDGEVWSDELSTGTKAITHLIIGTWQGFDTMIEKTFSEIHFSLRLVTTLTDLKVKFTTPIQVTREEAITLTGSYPRFGEAIFGQSNFAYASLERQVPVGMYVIGRWCQVQMRHSGLDEQFGLIGWSMTASPLGAVAATL